MKDIKRVIQRQWRASTVSWEAGGAIIPLAYDYPAEIIEIDSLVRDIAKSKGPLFVPRYSALLHRMLVKSCPLGERLIKCMKCDVSSIQGLFNKHKLSPYFTAFAAKRLSSDLTAACLHVDTLPQFNNFVDELRAEATRDGFAKAIEDQERAARKNAASLLQYIRALHDRFAKLVVVRIDLGYSTTYRATCGANGIDPTRAKAAFAAFVKRLHSAFPDLVGYAWKLEYGAVKSYHYHVMLLFNGHAVREDVTLGHMAGAIWVEEIEEGAGTYWNCNAKKDFYARAGLLGIGTIRYCDTEMRANLERAALYLTKVDYYVKLNEDGIGRVFGKGGLKSTGLGRGGRPRADKAAAEASGGVVDAAAVSG